MEDIDKNQFQPNNSEQDHGALQGNNVVVRNQTVPNGEAPISTHHLTTYTDSEKRWLIQADDEERSKGKGFMQRLKMRWNKRFPEKSNISKQNLRDNAVRFKKEFNVNSNSINVESSSAQIANSKWTNEMKLNLLKIEERERKKGRGFMKRIKDEWDIIYGNIPLSTQALRDNAARFRKDKALLSLIEVENNEDVEPTQLHITQDSGNNTSNEAEEQDQQCDTLIREHTDEEDVDAEDAELREMRMTFEKHLAFLTATTHDAITDRDRLLKHRKGVPDSEIDKANQILERHLNNTRDICRIVDAVYAMGRAIEDRRGMIRKSTINSTSQRGENRRIRKMFKRIKEVRQIVAWTANEIHRRRVKRKATEKEKENVQMLKKWADMELRRENDLKYVKEKALDELRYYLTKLKKTRLRDDRIRYNRMFREDQGMFYRKTQGMREKKGNAPHIAKFE